MKGYKHTDRLSRAFKFLEERRGKNSRRLSSSLLELRERKERKRSRERERKKESRCRSEKKKKKEMMEREKRGKQREKAVLQSGQLGHSFIKFACCMLPHLHYRQVSTVRLAHKVDLLSTAAAAALSWQWP